MTRLLPTKKNRHPHTRWRMSGEMLMHSKMTTEDTIDILENDRLQSSLLPRREFIFGTAAFAAGALLSLRESIGQTAGNNIRGIDFHHHFGPPQWTSFLASKNVLHPSWTGWTPTRSVEE